jgi:Zn-dependent alcohol dehydrogenase
MTDRPVSVTALLSVAMVAFGIGWWAKPVEVREVEVVNDRIVEVPVINGSVTAAGACQASVVLYKCEEPEPIPVPFVCRQGEWIEP